MIHLMRNWTLFTAWKLLQVKSRCQKEQEKRFSEKKRMAIIKHHQCLPISWNGIVQKDSKVLRHTRWATERFLSLENRFNDARDTPKETRGHAHRRETFSRCRAWRRRNKPEFKGGYTRFQIQQWGHVLVTSFSRGSMIIKLMIALYAQLQQTRIGPVTYLTRSCVSWRLRS